MKISVKYVPQVQKFWFGKTTTGYGSFKLQMGN